jgi:hypothetical protein
MTQISSAPARKQLQKLTVFPRSQSPCTNLEISAEVEMALQIREALMGASVSAEERIARALKCLIKGAGTLLLEQWT